jgi:hypothetical protein
MTDEKTKNVQANLLLLEKWRSEVKSKKTTNVDILQRSCSCCTFINPIGVPKRQMCDSNMDQIKIKVDTLISMSSCEYSPSTIWKVVTALFSGEN